MKTINILSNDASPPADQFGPDPLPLQVNVFTHNGNLACHGKDCDNAITPGEDYLRDNETNFTYCSRKCYESDH